MITSLNGSERTSGLLSERSMREKNVGCEGLRICEWACCMPDMAFSIMGVLVSVPERSRVMGVGSNDLCWSLNGRVMLLRMRRNRWVSVALLTGVPDRCREVWCVREILGSMTLSGRDWVLKRENMGVSGSNMSPDTQILAKESRLRKS